MVTLLTTLRTLRRIYVGTFRSSGYFWIFLDECVCCNVELNVELNVLQLHLIAAFDGEKFDVH